MSDILTHVFTEYAIRLPDGQLHQSDYAPSYDGLQDRTKVWFRRDMVDDTFANLRSKAVSAGTAAEFDARAAVVQPRVLVIGLPFREVS